MIVPMKHVTVLCLESEREKTLLRLAELGLVHLEETTGLGDNPRVKKARNDYDRVQQVLEHLEAHAGKKSSPENAGNSSPGLSQVLEAFQNLKELQEEKSRLDPMLAAWAPFGDFDPDRIEALTAAGIPVRLVKLEKARSDLPDLPETMVFHPISEDNRNVWGALVGEGALPENLRALDLPEIPTSEIRHRRDVVAEKIARLENFLQAAAAHLDALKREALRVDDMLALTRARERILREGPLAWLTGFCPREALGRLRKAAAEAGWGLVTRDPLPGEAPPTLLRHPAWVRPVKAVFDMLSIVPGYRETDIGPVFLVFFSLFFAMLIGDAGYGLLLLIATQAVALRRKQVPRHILTMLRILGGATLAWGILTGNYFGIDPARLPEFMQPRGSLLWLKNDTNIMRLCFLIGALHLSIAHAWNFVLYWPDRKAWAQLGWLAILWSMYATACGMVLQDPYPGWLPYGLLLGIGLVVLFMTPFSELKQRWIDHAMLPLSLINAMVDIISYIRLFAVGVATLQVAESFNNMAGSLALPLLVRLPVALLILLLGHGLNIALGGLSILVHGVRLNTLEFSQHKGLEWSGFPYAPLHKKTTTDYTPQP